MTSAESPEYAPPSSKENDYRPTPIFIFLHGSWERAKHFDPLRRRLEARGAYTIAEDWQADQQDAPIDYIAQDLARKIEFPEITSLVPHSHAGNLGPRIASILEDQDTPLAHMVYLNAGFEWTNDHYFGGGDESIVPGKYQDPDFHRNITDFPMDPNLKIYNPRLVRKHFFNGCRTADADWAVANLRPQYRPSDPLPPILRWPKTESTFIIGTKDRIISPRYSRFVAKALDATIKEVYTGHSGYISHTELHAGILHDIVEKTLIKNVDRQE